MTLGVKVGVLVGGMVPAGASASPRYALPLPGAQVAAGFDPTATPYGPGHRGVDLRAAQGDQVRAAADGTVTFAGPVAGRGVVVVLHRDGIRTTYEPIDPSTSAGAIVRRGEVIGLVAGEHAGRDDVLHWGARRGEAYLDPLRLIRPLGVVRLSPRP
ncbi:MAG: Peptidase [Jatrophihabitantaceae bacterium]|nr:Peptidase [Jatrophihabitantaceae bacterium]